MEFTLPCHFLVPPSLLLPSERSGYLAWQTLIMVHAELLDAFDWSTLQCSGNVNDSLRLWPLAFLHAMEK